MTHRRASKEESLFKIMLLWLKIYLCWCASRICSKASLFLVYINDIAKQLPSLTWLFADNSSLFYASANIADIAGIINDIKLG